MLIIMASLIIQILNYNNIEFLLASINKKKILSEENLRNAFKLFDKVNYNIYQDGNGTISADEVKTILGLGKQFSEDVWTEVIKEVDQNSDGEISFEEFNSMMKKFITD